MTALVGDARQVVIAAKKGSASILLAVSGILPDSLGRHIFDVPTPSILTTVIKGRRQNVSDSGQNARAPLTNRDRSFIAESFFAAA